MSRTLCIGDIHGGLRGLKQVLERAEVTTEDEIIFLGDYVDGWADTAPLIQFLIELNKTHKCIFLRGNHDWWCETWLTTGVAPYDWTTHGGVSTLDSYKSTLGIDMREHAMFFYKLNKYYVDDQNRAFVHGGYSSESGVVGCHTSTLYWNRDLFELAVRAEVESFAHTKKRARMSPKRLEAHTEVFVGHTTTLLAGTDEPIRALNLWNLDTGAGSNGKLTIMDVDTFEYWQSDLLKELYPDDPHAEYANQFK